MPFVATAHHVVLATAAAARRALAGPVRYRPVSSCRSTGAPARRHLPAGAYQHHGVGRCDGSAVPAGEQLPVRGIAPIIAYGWLAQRRPVRSLRAGWFTELRLTVKKRMRATLKAIREQLRKKMHLPIPQVGKWLAGVVRGYFNYFAVPGNAYRLTSFRSEVCRAWRRMLMRRSQRHRLSWQRFNCLVKRHIPPYRNMHPYPSERFYVKHPR